MNRFRLGDVFEIAAGSKFTSSPIGHVSSWRETEDRSQPFAAIITLDRIAQHFPTNVRKRPMSKFNKQRAVGHNIADSVASGIGLMVGIYSMDVYAEAAASPNGYIDVDFLTGATSGGAVTQTFADAIKKYQAALPKLCESHGIEVADFRKLTARFSGQGVLKGFSVTTEDHQSRCSTDEFSGSPGKRVKVLDRLGRIRPK